MHQLESIQCGNNNGFSVKETICISENGSRQACTILWFLFQKYLVYANQGFSKGEEAFHWSEYGCSACPLAEFWKLNGM